jgi:Zn-dependent protease with chaperone function
MQISKQLFGSLQGMATGFFMSLFMSFAMLLLSIGFVDGFLMIWLRSFGIGFVVSIPISLVIVPLTERLLRRCFQVVE